MSMEGLRQGAQNIESGRKKGSSRSSYYISWRPPALTLPRFLAAPPAEESYLGVSEPIVLIKGSYPDLFYKNEDGSIPSTPPIIEGYRFRAHKFSVFVKPENSSRGFTTYKDMICSAGPEPHAPQPCVGCHEVDHGTDAKPRDQWAFNIAHLGYYHHRPLIKDGQPITKKNSSDYVMVKDECLNHKMENILLGRAAQARMQGVKPPKQCEGCKGNHPYIFGDRRVLQLGHGHLKNLFAIEDELGKKCVNCSTYILRTDFVCGNENCNALVLSIRTSGWTNDQIDQFSKTQHQCMTCGFVGLPRSKYECGFNEQYSGKVNGGCPPNVEPKIMTIFDAVLWIQREGENKDSKIVLKKFVPISQYQTQDGRPLTDHLAEIVKEPFNLPEVFAPASLDDQAELINKQNPYKPQQPAWQPYGVMPPMPGALPSGGQPNYGYPNQAMPAYPGYQQQPPPQQQYPTTDPNQYPNIPVPGRPNYGK